MELVDRLLAILAGPSPRHASKQLMAAGYTEDEVRGAWNFPRSAGYQDRSGWGGPVDPGWGKARAAMRGNR